MIVSGSSYDSTVQVWAADGSPRGEPLEGHTGGVWAVALGTLTGEDVIVSGDANAEVRIWAADGSPRGKPLYGHEGPVSTVALGTLAGEDVIVSCSTFDSTLQIRAADGSLRGEQLQEPTT